MEKMSESVAVHPVVLVKQLSNQWKEKKRGAQLLAHTFFRGCVKGRGKFRTCWQQVFPLRVTRLHGLSFTVSRTYQISATPVAKHFEFASQPAKPASQPARTFLRLLRLSVSPTCLPMAVVLGLISETMIIIIISLRHRSGCLVASIFKYYCHPHPTAVFFLLLLFSSKFQSLLYLLPRIIHRSFIFLSALIVVVRWISPRQTTFYWTIFMRAINFRRGPRFRARVHRPVSVSFDWLVGQSKVVADVEHEVFNSYEFSDVRINASARIIHASWVSHRSPLYIYLALQFVFSV